MCDELCRQDLELMPLPKDWTDNVRHAVLNVIGIVRIAMLSGREFLIQEDRPDVAQVHRLETEVAMQREELRINGARTSRIDPHQRPQYLPTERMAILELRAMRGWSKAETARRFFVSDDTIRAWLRLLASVDGLRRFQERAIFRGSNRGARSDLAQGRHPSQTLDCRPRPHVQVRSLRGGVVRREEHPAAVRSGRRTWQHRGCGEISQNSQRALEVDHDTGGAIALRDGNRYDHSLV